MFAVSDFKNPFATDDFLANYWQQSPLLLRQAIVLDDLIDGDELAGLAMEPNIESRLVQYQPERQQWQLQQGPFTEETFSTLPADNWTLLVQAVDHWLPEVRQVLNRFSFLPSWRIDDIMISFATDRGGVGPHFDQYDVFLVQLSGQREWQIGQLCDDDSELVAGLPVKILADFASQERWVLEPGDVLYLPPALAHWGTSIGNSMTLSVGFRAPADSEIISDFGHFLAGQVSDFQRYNDSQIEHRGQQPHAITAADIARLKSRIKHYLDDDDRLAHWFGQYMTEPKYDDSAVDTGHWSYPEFTQHWQHSPLFRNPASRLAHYQDKLFVDGQMQEISLPKDELNQICSHEIFDYAIFYTLSEAGQHALWTLVNSGALFFED